MVYTKIVLVLLLIVLIGCSDSSNPTDSSGKTNSNLAGYPVPDISGTDINGVLTTIQVEIANPIPGFPGITTNIGFAYFGNGENAGKVSVNANEVPLTNQGGTNMYMLPSPSNPLAMLTNVYFNGSSHTWAVSGGGSVASFTGSVSSPVTFNMIAPVAGTTVSKSQALQVTWGSGTSSKVLIQIVSTGSNNAKVYPEQSDNGSFTIPAADLSSFSGDCMVYIVKYNYNIISANSKNYALISEIVKSHTIKVN